MSFSAHSQLEQLTYFALQMQLWSRLLLLDLPQLALWHDRVEASRLARYSLRGLHSFDSRPFLIHAGGVVYLDRLVAEQVLDQV